MPNESIHCINNYLFGIGRWQRYLRIGVLCFFILFHIRPFFVPRINYIWVCGFLGLLIVNAVLFHVKLWTSKHRKHYHEKLFATSIQRAWMDIFSYCIVLGVTSPIWCKQVCAVGETPVEAVTKTWHCVALLMTLLLAIIYYINLFKNADEVNKARHLFASEIGLIRIGLIAIISFIALIPIVEALLIILNGTSLWMHFDKNIVNRESYITYIVIKNITYTLTKHITYIGIFEENIYILSMVISSLSFFILLDKKSESFYINTEQSVLAIEFMRRLLREGAISTQSIPPRLYDSEMIEKLCQHEYIIGAGETYSLTCKGKYKINDIDKNTKMTINKLRSSISQLHMTFLYGNLPAMFGFVVLFCVGLYLSYHENSNSAFIAGGTAMQMILGNFTVATALKDFSEE